MATNRTVEYIDLGLDSATAYWSTIVSPQHEAFERNICPATAFPLAISLWHVQEWVWHEDHPGEDTRGNTVYAEYKRKLFEACPDLEWLRDVADASKHRGLSRSPLAVTGVSYRPAVSGAVGTAAVGTLPIGGSLPARMVIVMSDGSVGDLVVSIRSAYKFWQTQRFGDPRE